MPTNRFQSKAIKHENQQRFEKEASVETAIDSKMRGRKEKDEESEEKQACAFVPFPLEQ